MIVYALRVQAAPGKANAHAYVHTRARMSVHTVLAERENPYLDENWLVHIRIVVHRLTHFLQIIFPENVPGVHMRV